MKIEHNLFGEPSENKYKVCRCNCWFLCEPFLFVCAPESNTINWHHWFHSMINYYHFVRTFLIRFYLEFLTVCLFLRVAAVLIWNFCYGMAVRRFSLEFRYAHTKRYTLSVNVYANRFGFGSVNDLKLCWYRLRLNEFSVDINRR